MRFGGGGVPQRPVGSPACLDTCCGKWEFLMEKQAAQLGINLKYETFCLSRGSSLKSFGEARRKVFQEPPRRTPRPRSNCALPRVRARASQPAVWCDRD